MNGHALLPAIVAALIALPVPGAAQAPTDAPPIEQIGESQYRIGKIVVDKAAARFTLPGKVLHLEDALEYLAVSVDGGKAYESLLELDATPTEFNLACILIGLDDKQSVKPRYQFDENDAAGQAVAINITWTNGERENNVSGANAMMAGKEAFDDDSWVYIGSAMTEDGQIFLADMSGALISFVHDPTAIIDHVSGAGIGAYGLLTGNEQTLPPEGSPISLSVELIDQ